MANKAISELPQAQNVNNQDLFVLEQSGIAKKLTAETFITEQGIIDALAEALDGHGGIQSVTLASVSGRIRTYRITFSDGSATTFQVYDGTTIERIAKTSTAGLVDTYTIFMNDGTTTFFTVTNGADGEVSSSSIATTFDPAKSYTKGNYVWYGGQLYVFTSDRDAGAWDQSDVESVAIGNELSNLKSALSVQNDIMLANATPTNYSFVIGGVNGGDGSENTSVARAKTDFIPYVNDEIIVEADDDYLISVAYYDANKTWIISHWWYGSPYTLKGYSRNEIQNTKYIKIVLKRADDGDINIDDVNANVRIGIKGNYPRTYTVEQDGSGDFSSLVDAIYVAEEHMGSIVYVGKGVWNIISDLGSTYISNVSSTQRGIYLKNRIKVVCSPDCLITAIYDGSRALTAQWLSIFNAGEYGFTLENARLSGKNIRYCVHDERDSDTDYYINSYINCRMMLDNSENVHTSAVQCIGGGLGLYGVINIDKCFFYSVNSQNIAWPAVSYHNTADSSNINGRSLIFINDCYFESNNTVRISYYGNSTNISYALVMNNWLGREVIYGPETDDSSSSNVNITVTKWNNRIRNIEDDGTITPASSSISFDPNFSSLTAKNGIAILTFLINGVNLTTSNQHIATLSYKPTKRTMVVIYDKSSGSIAEGYVDFDGKLYSKAYAPLSGTNLRGSCSFVIA